MRESSGHSSRGGHARLLLWLAITCGCTTLAGSADFEDAGDASPPDDRPRTSSVSDAADAADATGDASAARCPPGFDAASGGREDARLLTGSRGAALDRFALWGASAGEAGKVYVFGNAVGCVSSSDSHDAAVVRLNANAEVDTTFGDGGRVCLTRLGAPTPRHSFFASMTRDARGRLVLAGETSTGGVPWGLVARLDADGTPDESFGPDGVRSFPLGDTPGLTSLSLHDVVADDDGVVVAGGEQNLFAPSTNYGAVIRLRDDGSRDMAFHGGAWVDLETRTFTSIVLVPGGYAVAGSTRVGVYGRVARLDRTGALVETFGQRGIATLMGRALFTPTSAVVDDRGGIVLAGGSTEPSPGDTATRLTLARVDANGHLDETFGVGGTVRTAQRWDPPYLRPSAMARRCDGRLILVVEDGTDWALVRFTPRGAFDETFATRGLLRLRQGGSVRAAILDPATQTVTAVGVAAGNGGKLGDLPSLWRVETP